MANLCLNMIVRNEADKIERALQSTIPHVSRAVILDTGSTDGTQDKIRAFFGKYKIPCQVIQGEFRNFAQARNEALFAAHAMASDSEYILLMDADMELRVSDMKALSELKDAAYSSKQIGGPLSYYNTRLVRRAHRSQYVGATHEYLDVGYIPANCDAIWFVDHADGSSRPEKYPRDEKLLLGEIEANPKNARAHYYLAQTYRDWGKTQLAADYFKKRAAMGGWDEEVFVAQLNYGCMLKDLGDEGGFVKETLKAYDMRPTRAEPLYDLAKYYREKPDQQQTAIMFARRGMTIKQPNDHLFVNNFVYQTGLREEFAIAGYYSKDPKEKHEAFTECDALSVDIRASKWTRDQARQNLYHFLPPLSREVPSLVTRKIEFTAPAGYTAMNPSIAKIKGETMAVIRCVNYTIDKDGRYCIGGKDGEIVESNPIRTRNFLVYLNGDGKVTGSGEILPPVDQPDPLYKLVIGFEDMRLFDLDGNPWISACVRQMNADGMCEQVMARVAKSDEATLADRVYRLDRLRVMLPQTRLHEKNWQPCSNGDRVLFQYRLDTTINTACDITGHHKLNLDTSHISGGTQLIPFRDGFLSLVHEAHNDPSRPGCRYYLHRFVFYDTDLRADRLSHPFYIKDRGIEFAAGLVLVQDQLVVSFGFKDKEPWLASMNRADVETMLWPK